MRKLFRLTIIGVLLAAAASLGGVISVIHAKADDVTISQDNSRDGWDQNEPGLEPATLTGGTFGQLFKTQLSGQIYAQPLVVGNSVIVATEEDDVYSLNSQTGAINWQLSLGPAWPSSVIGCGDLTPNIGVTSTPVYDSATGELYLTAVINDGTSLYQPDVDFIAINAQTGAKDWQTPIQGAPSNDPSQPFDPLTERQRASLLLLDGSVYLGFASYCDYVPYVGYVAGVNVSSHALTLWSDEAGTTDNQGGIWQGGGGLMSDGSGRIFVSTGNGVSPPPGAGTSPPAELGDAVVQLGVQSDGTLAAQDFFSPANAPTLDTSDQDFGSGGPVALPYGTTADPDLLVQVGKDGRLFVLNRDNLGGRGATTDKPVSQNGPYKGEWGHPAAFAGTGGADYLYYAGSGDYLRALKFNTTNATFSDAANSTMTFGDSSGSPAVTSNGTDPSSAVVWEISRSATDSTLDAFAGVPAAGSTKLTELWSAPIGAATKFTTPATDNGRVYVGTQDGIVYGFGSPDAAPLTGTSSPATTAVGTPVTIPVTLTAKTAVTITGVSTTDPSFTAGTPSATTLAAGQTSTVDVTFNPTAPGGVSASLQVATSTADGYTVSIPLSGDGTETGLFASPTSLAFGDVPTGNSETLQTTILNGGTTAETITTTAPSAPFTISDAPASLAAGASATVNVTYKPAAAENDTGSVTLTGSAGAPLTVDLTGTGVTGAGTLGASPTSVSFANTALGQRAEQVVDVTNNGNLPMTITGFDAPPQSPFGTPDPVTTGLTLDPGYDLQLPVTFTPQSASATTGSYTLTATDGRNAPQTLTIPVSGTGTAPTSGVAVPEPGGGWTLNGNAQMTGTKLGLTTATKGENGSAVYYQPLTSDGLHATFTATMGGGSGADGLTFALLNASDSSTSSLGGGGDKLGFGGQSGVAVTLDTYPKDLVGIATGTNAAGLTYAASSTAVPNLRSGSHTVGVTVTGSTVTVTIDGKQVLSAAVTMPSTVLAAFTGSTGGLDDAHDVSAVSISSPTAAVPPPGGGWSYNGSAAMSGSDTLLTRAVNSQSGSVVYPEPVTTNGLSVEFTMQIGGGTGADGLTFALLSPTTSATARGYGASGLGFDELSGVAVAFDTYQVSGYPSSNFAGIATGAVKTGELKFLTTVHGIGQLRSGTHDVLVTVSGGVMSVYLDDALIMQKSVSLSSDALLAFTGGTGAKTDVHLVRDVAISAAGFNAAATGNPVTVVTPTPRSSVPAGVPTDVPAGATPPALTVESVTVGTSALLTTPSGQTLYRPATAAATAGSGYQPFLVSPGSTLRLPVLLHGHLGTVTRPDGTLQLTYDGSPLYVFSADHASGETNGASADWSVIKV